ncbi:MAG: heme-degrading domain-containing protein [Paracoccaceae bacterium]
MTNAPSRADLEDEARQLVLAAFTEDTALALGVALLGLARAGGLPVVIDIRSADRCFFHAALPGSAPLNDLWARRKSATALVFQEASLLVGTRHREGGGSLEKNGLPLADHADHGGAVPIRVRGVGVVAVVTVSGLPQVEDHRLAVRALRMVLEEGQAPA